MKKSRLDYHYYKVGFYKIDSYKDNMAFTKRCSCLGEVLL